jgi:hypothetical protein
MESSTNNIARDIQSTLLVKAFACFFGRAGEQRGLAVFHKICYFFIQPAEVPAIPCRRARNRPHYAAREAAL